MSGESKRRRPLGPLDDYCDELEDEIDQARALLERCDDEFYFDEFDDPAQLQLQDDVKAFLSRSRAEAPKEPDAPRTELDLSRVSREALEALAANVLDPNAGLGIDKRIVSRIRAEATAALCYEGDCAKMTGRARPCPVHDAQPPLPTRAEAEIPPSFRRSVITAEELRRCAVSHEPGVRLVGNVRAGDIAEMCSRVQLLEEIADDVADMLDGEPSGARVKELETELDAALDGMANETTARVAAESALASARTLLTRWVIWLKGKDNRRTLIADTRAWLSSAPSPAPERSDRWNELGELPVTVMATSKYPSPAPCSGCAAARELLEHWFHGRGYVGDETIDAVTQAFLASAPAQTPEPARPATYPGEWLDAAANDLKKPLPMSAEAKLAAVETAWNKLDRFWSDLSSQELYGEALHELMGAEEESSDLDQLTELFQAVRDLLRARKGG